MSNLTWILGSFGIAVLMIHMLAVRIRNARFGHYTVPCHLFFNVYSVGIILACLAVPGAAASRRPDQSVIHSAINQKDDQNQQQLLTASLSRVGTKNPNVVYGDSKNGEGIYRSNCAACHQLNGSGMMPVFPALAGSQKVLDPSADYIIQVLLEGVSGTAMVSFRDRLSTQEIADVLTYIRSSWDNNAGPVSRQQIESVKK